MSAPVLERPLTDDTPAGRRRPGRDVIALLVLGVVGLMAGITMLVLGLMGPAAAPMVHVDFPGDEFAFASDYGNAEAYGVEGSWIVAYGDGATTTMTMDWSGDEIVDVQLGEDDYPMMIVTDVVTSGDHLEVEIEFGNCRWYHERELETHLGMLLIDADGDEHPVTFDKPVLVHSPMLWQCPDRTIDRGDDLRSRT